MKKRNKAKAGIQSRRDAKARKYKAILAAAKQQENGEKAQRSKSQAFGDYYGSAIHPGAGLAMSALAASPLIAESMSTRMRREQ